ncbi:MAG: YceI family protein [Deltaproteobacteria bacterium]|nr:YceI family protein [Deltaproteobacteria bacterium]
MRRCFPSLPALVLVVGACADTSDLPSRTGGDDVPPETPADADEIVRPSDGLDDEDPAAAGGGAGGAAPPAGGGSDSSADDGTDAAGDGGTAPPVPPTPPLVTARSSGVDSLLYALVWRDPSALGNGFAHDHVVRATIWAGTLQFRVGDASDCFVDIDLETAGMLNDEPNMRAEVGLDGTLTDSDRETVREHMLGEDQLAAESFATISFTSTACRGDVDGDGTLSVDGDLTIRDVTRPVTWSVTYRVGSDGRLFAQGNLTVSQTEFGITPYSAFFGAVRVADDVDLAFDLVGSPAAP